MTWPTDDIQTSSLDSDTDRPDRRAFLNLFRRVKEMIAGRGQPNGVAALNQQGKLVSAQLPAASQRSIGAGRIATGAEAQAGTDHSKLMTPLRTRQAINEFADIPTATTEVKGKVELATDAEVRAGTDNQRVVTARGIIGVIETFREYRRVFNATGTEHNWVIPDDVRRVIVEVWGGGGGGGSADHYDRGSGGGGGGGGYCRKVISVSPGQRIRITVGRGGQNGNSAFRTSPKGRDGKNGETSSFGHFCSATGGQGGKGEPGLGQGGQGGMGIGGDVNLRGERGENSPNPNSSVGGSGGLSGFPDSDWKYGTGGDGGSGQRGRGRYGGGFFVKQLGAEGRSGISGGVVITWRHSSPVT